MSNDCFSFNSFLAVQYPNSFELQGCIFQMEDDKISISEEHSVETNSVDSLSKPGQYRTTFPDKRHFPLRYVAIFEPEYKNGIFPAIIVSMRAGFALFHGCRLRLKPGPYNTTKSIPARPLRLFVVDGTPHCAMLPYLNPNIKTVSSPRL